nr:MAG TPA: hypothetical protein [Caudoviricetes sp.]
MKKQDIMHFFDEHKTEIICLGVGIGIGAYAVYRHYLGPICANEHGAIIRFKGSDAKKAAHDLVSVMNAPKDATTIAYTTGYNTTTEAIKTINQELTEVGDAEKILWWIEKF